MTDTTSSLSDLIEISEDGFAFYEEASQKVKDKKLSSLFAKLAKVKSDLVTELSGEVKAPAKKRSRTTTRKASTLGDLSQAYDGLRKQPPAAPAGQIIDHERIHHGPGLMAPSGFVTPKR